MVHRACFRTVLHPPRSIWIVEDLVAIWAFQHRGNAERIVGIRGFVDPFNEMMDPFDTGNYVSRSLIERSRLNRSKVWKKRSKDTRPLCQVVDFHDVDLISGAL